jgi:hypothetical protein
MMRWRLAGTLLLLGAVLLPATPAAAAVGQPASARAGVVRGSTWLLRTSLSGGSAQVQFNFGLAGDQKLMGDWNGDGTRTPGVFRNGTWYLRDRNGAGGRYVSFPFGAAGDTPVAGDWNGDGIATIGFFRAGCWHLRNANSTGSSHIIACYGRQPGDVPVVGDWDGDGIDTIGIFRQGCWHLRNANSAGSAQLTACFGAVGDRPLAGDWNRDGTDSRLLCQAAAGVARLAGVSNRWAWSAHMRRITMLARCRLWARRASRLVLCSARFLAM